ncbi:hypothetical protein SAMN05444161_7118 [Rhizobiales bacterium GAS191]|nr:hypothetical protein SAMN05519103_06465 [Rhizobiales bacterium GAS113]SEE77807.1 hypothetical protein SAMN05444161_7118 [Rhizobiales bacterium GAS191]
MSALSVRVFTREFAQAAVKSIAARVSGWRRKMR